MFRRLAIPEVFVFTPARYRDDRGWFSEIFNEKVFGPETGGVAWVQDNQSLSLKRGTLRGMHFQTPPFAQDKLARCVRGSLLDVAVDIRRGSPTYGGHVSAVLTAEGGEQIFVPRGFAHGFLTLEDNCEIAYKVSNYYDKASDRSLLWNDPALGIEWGAPEGAVVLSEKDATAPLLADMPEYFRYPG